ncbi:MAG: lysophospholipid acyltransferase family protein [Herpetosiphonaceae bacterium]|nr:lysophospholipid acyltransferase family protein [Herpetosiphonaceae bacterium]
MYAMIAYLTTDARRLARIRRWGSWLPAPGVTALCWLLAALLWVVAPGLRRRVKTNMREVLPDSARRGQTLVYFVSLWRLLYEVMIGVYHLKRDGADRFKLEGAEQLEAALALGRGVILFAPHLGNFFYAYWYLCSQYPCLTVGTAASPELRPLYQTFYDLGCDGLDYDTTPPREMLRTLRRHLANNGVVLLLGDFWRPAFPRARMFGHDVRSPQGAAVFALEDGVPIVPFHTVRAGCHQRLVFGPARHLSQEFARHERTAATNSLNQWLATTIARHPTQWLYWFNVAERWEDR